VIHFADATSASPVSPFTSWNTAATTIQDAADAALPGEIVLVTNGVYASGGRSVTGDLTNRVTIDQPILVASVNGWRSTTIQGAWDPVSTNGPLAVRCVWMTNGAVLSGFTIQNGATLGNQISSESRYSGGGVWCSSISAAVSDCILTNNSANAYGGGAAYGGFNNCFIAGNNSFAGYGGGAAYAFLTNCTVVSNFILPNGSALLAGGVYFGNGGNAPRNYAVNCIILYNFSTFSLGGVVNYNFPANIVSSCTDPLVSAAGNIDVIPQFIDTMHISATSPCRGAGMPGSASGFDIDGESWASPPSMGCDEVADAALVGPLSVSIQPWLTNSVLNKPLYFAGSITGRASRLSWSFDDGPSITNADYTVWHTWTNSGDYAVTFTAYNNDDPGGVSTNLFVHIQALILPVLQSPAVNNNAFQFQFYGQANSAYNVWTTTNLSTVSSNWQRIQVLFGNDALLQVTVPYSAANPAQFYRVQPW
jgi:hypothetical protein